MIHVEHHGPLTVVAIDRPERRNALDHDALDGLLGALAAAMDLGSRVLVLTGSGGHFCAGADLTTVEDEGFVAKLHELLDGSAHRAHPHPGRHRRRRPGGGHPAGHRL